MFHYLRVPLGQITPVLCYDASILVLVLTSLVLQIWLQARRQCKNRLDNVTIQCRTVRLGPGPTWARVPLGPGPTWARAHLGLGPTWARALRNFTKIVDFSKKSPRFRGNTVNKSKKSKIQKLRWGAPDSADWSVSSRRYGRTSGDIGGIQEKPNNHRKLRKNSKIMIFRIF